MMGSLTVAVFGATGVAGRGVVEACLADSRVEELRAVVRLPLGLEHEKLREIECRDFLSLEGAESALSDVDAVYYCLGRAVSQVSGEAEYRVLTFEYALAAANTLMQRSPTATFHFISGQGTNPKSRMMWARVKGETEVALQSLSLGGLVCWRPGLILAEKAPPDLSFSYRIGYPVLRALYFLKTLAVTSRDLGDAMLQLTLDDRRDGVVENREIRKAAARHIPSRARVSSSE